MSGLDSDDVALGSQVWRIVSMLSVFRAAIFGGWFLLLIGGNIGAQEQRARIIPQKAIEIGQRIDDSVGILRVRGIKHGEALYAETGGSPDDASISFMLDMEHAIARVHYSKSKGTVGSISIAFRPSKRSGRVDYVWLDAQSIRPEPDGSHFIHFSPPSER